MTKLVTHARNAFDDPVPLISSLLECAEARTVVRQSLVNVLMHVEISEIESGETADFVIREGRRCSTTADYERVVHQHLQDKGIVDIIPGKLQNRSALIFSQISDFIPVGSSVIDIGCGDAEVGVKVAQAGNSVHVCDVYEHPKVSTTGLPFSLFLQGESLPFEDNSFDIALVLTVFHHSDDPIHLINECSRVLKNIGRLIVIESVYGIKTSSTAPNPETECFAKLDSEAQRLSNIFFDHFYNRVVHYSEDPSCKVNVPFNFNTPSNWNALFQRGGLTEVETVDLGIDQPIVPEYHTLHIFDKVTT